MASKPKERKSKVVVRQVTGLGYNKKPYRVKKLHNRTEPAIGEFLSKTDIDHLLETDPACDVEIVQE